MSSLLLACLDIYESGLHVRARVRLYSPQSTIRLSIIFRFSDKVPICVQIEDL
jgi:hypothetical protein